MGHGFFTPGLPRRIGQIVLDHTRSAAPVRLPDSVLANSFSIDYACCEIIRTMEVSIWRRSGSRVP
jgi:hypothetical protein